ncbi:uncharacterized protein LOC116013165 [Ipomoea triloba]|uniref:uncharacterized protein LOC116013165 n=1 Tax=Ipomoea triloba TaxID=35885 RepID=UPI00125D8693|nr:uncharacterized protein LOC116013165 [Ipomoea triloba]
MSEGLQFGGMGFREVRKMNMAMLGKQGWNFLTKLNALVSRVFKARFFPNCSFLEAGVGSNPSFVWTSIRESQVLLWKGVRRRIGDGGLVRVWGEPWLPDSANPFVSTPDPGYLGNSLVRSLFDTHASGWDMELVRDVFNDRDALLILSIPIPLVPSSDIWYWERELHGLYSVKSAYRLSTGEGVLGGAVAWAGVNCDPICSFCGEEVESVIHLFANCSFAHSCWRLLENYWSLERVESIETWVEGMWEHLTRDRIEQVVAICWMLWEARNNVIFNSKNADPGTVTRLAIMYIQNWKAAQVKGALNQSAGSDQLLPDTWRPPTLGVYKINVDAAVDISSRSRGHGLPHGRDRGREEQWPAAVCDGAHGQPHGREVPSSFAF